MKKRIGSQKPVGSHVKNEGDKATGVSISGERRNLNDKKCQPCEEVKQSYEPKD